MPDRLPLPVSTFPHGAKSSPLPVRSERGGRRIRANWKHPGCARHFPDGRHPNRRDAAPSSTRSPGDRLARWVL